MTEIVAWRYQRKEGWGDIWRCTTIPVSFETPDDWIVQPLCVATPAVGGEAALQNLSVGLDEIIQRTVNPAPTLMSDRNVLDWVNGKTRQLYAAVSATLVAQPASPLRGREIEDWRDDPSSDERWNAGVDCAMKLFCDYLGVDPEAVTWDAATETVDGDISAVIGNILRTKYGEDWSPASPPEQPQKETK